MIFSARGETWPAAASLFQFKPEHGKFIELEREPFQGDFSGHDRRHADLDAPVDEVRAQPPRVVQVQVKFVFHLQGEAIVRRGGIDRQDDLRGLILLLADAEQLELGPVDREPDVAGLTRVDQHGVGAFRGTEGARTEQGQQDLQGFLHGMLGPEPTGAFDPRGRRNRQRNIRRGRPFLPCRSRSKRRQVASGSEPQSYSKQRQDEVGSCALHFYPPNRFSLAEIYGLARAGQANPRGFLWPSLKPPVRLLQPSPRLRRTGAQPKSLARLSPNGARDFGRSEEHTS